MTPEAFANRMKQIANAVPANANAIKKHVASVFVIKVVPGTPVDTSLHRSRWQVGISGPATSIHEAFFKGKHGSTAEASTDKAIQLAQAQIDRVLPGQDIYVGNNGPAIRRLNEGYSKQAPARFIEVAAREAIIAMHGLAVIR